MKKKILIIDDDPVMTLVCQRMLDKQGYETECARDGVSGIERLPNFQPDAILLDLMMPKVNGVKFLEWLRAHESFHQLPVIVLTNAAVPILIEQAAHAGATCILDKSKFGPVAITELLRGLLHTGATTPLSVPSESTPWSA